MLQKFLNNVTSLSNRYTPSALSPKKRFAKGLITAASLMTMADGKAEDSEVEAASRIIFKHRFIAQFLSPSEAQEIYSMQISALQQAASKGSADTLLQVNGMVAEIADTVKDQAWRNEIVEVAQTIGRSNGSGQIGTSELMILNKIREALA